MFTPHPEFSLRPAVVVNTRAVCSHVWFALVSRLTVVDVLRSAAALISLLARPLSPAAVPYSHVAGLSRPRVALTVVACQHPPCGRSCCETARLRTGILRSFLPVGRLCVPEQLWTPTHSLAFNILRIFLEQNRSTRRAQTSARFSI